MIEDDLVMEVRTAREAFCRQFGFDLEAIVHELREQERTGGRRVVRLPPRAPTRTNHEIHVRPATQKAKR